MWAGLMVALTAWFFTYGIPLVIRLLVGLGVGWATFSGAQFVVDQGTSYVMSEFNGLPSDALAVLRIAGFDQAFSIIFAGWTTYITVKVAMGSYNKWTTRAATLRA